MNLSKIYRGPEADGLQQFQFRSFGDPEAVVLAEADAFIFSSPVYAYKMPAVVLNFIQRVLARITKNKKRCPS